MSIASVVRRTPIHVPAAEVIGNSQLTAFMQYCEQRTGRTFSDQAGFHEFSVQQFREFWRLFLAWSDIVAEGELEPVCTSDDVERAAFFPGLRLNYAENLLRFTGPDDDKRLALVAVHDDGREPEHLTRRELRRLTCAAAAGLRARGVVPGDRVVAVMRNDAEAVIAALACAAIGAAFASAAPEMGVPAILSRFRQLDPRVLIWDCGAGQRTPGRMVEIVRGLPTLHAVVLAGDTEACESTGLPEIPLVPKDVQPIGDMPRFPFNHPLFILFSSGTTGAPKCIVHGAGGTLLEHMKEHRLHGDLRRDDILFFHTSCAWMMWNWQLSALITGAPIVLFDGVIAGPATLWDIVAAHDVTVFGTSAPYLKLCQDHALRPMHELPALRSVLSTGSILYDPQFDWVVENVKCVPVQSVSGGTDIIGCFVLGSPNLPVYRGEAQCRTLGLDVQSLGEPGQAGELVCHNPFPSRPLGFWGDAGGSRFHAAYFSQNPGVWTHGDYISFTPEGSARLHGRSDGVMNIRGIRVGPADIYAVLQKFPAIKEAMAVEQRVPDDPNESRLVLLVVLRPGITLDAELMLEIRKAVGRECSPVHVPAVIADVAALPTTHSGKRSESAARAAVNGESVKNADALANPESLATIAQHPALRAPASRPEQDIGDGTLESQLQAIWEAAFGFAPISEDDDFFELGGHSLLAMSIFARIQEKFGRGMPIATLFQAPTIAMLATVMRASAEDRFSCLVPVLPGSGRAFFLVHGLSGTVLELARFLNAMRGGRPVAVLQAKGLDPGSEPQASVQAMASEYLREIRTVQPKGPYSLGGFSFGGLVAYEMACQLAAVGEQVDLLTLVDTGAHPRNLTWREWFSHRRYRLAMLAREIAATPGKALLTEFDFIRNGVLLRLGRLPRWQDPALAHLPPVLSRVRAACELAYTSYNPPPYAGRVTYFRATRREVRGCDPLLIWRRVAPDIELVAVDCRHLELVQPPHTGRVAEVLRARLAG